jgi:signal transduction histidine kinase
MSSPPASAALLPDAPAPAASGARAAFVQVVNPGTVAVVFYLALIFVVSRLALSMHLESVSALAIDALRYLRQTLISGLTVLFAIGLAEAALEGRRSSPTAALGCRVLAVAVAAVAAAFLRLLVANGQIGPRIEWTWFVPTVGIWAMNGGLGYALLRYARFESSSQQQLVQAARDREALAAQGVEARLSALQAQIEPHFLFNTLAHVQRLYETEPGRGRDMLRSLIDYLRAALPSMRRSGSSLRRELELARSFLTILQLRMGDRLAFDIRVEPALLDAAVPPMVLPTLVENAVKHGLSPLPQGGRIDISARRCADGRLEIVVADNGQGLVAASGTGVGLANTRSRLAALFGERAALELRSGEPTGFVARVVMPLRLDAAADGPALPAGQRSVMA